MIHRNHLHLPRIAGATEVPCRRYLGFCCGRQALVHLQGSLHHRKVKDVPLHHHQLATTHKEYPPHQSFSLLAKCSDCSPAAFPSSSMELSQPLPGHRELVCACYIRDLQWCICNYDFHCYVCDIRICLALAKTPTLCSCMSLSCYTITVESGPDLDYNYNWVSYNRLVSCPGSKIALYFLKQKGFGVYSSTMLMHYTRLGFEPGSFLIKQLFY